MSEKIPKFQRAVVIDEFKGKPYVKQIPVPEPKPGEVLIRVECSSINPADNSFLKGQYSSKRKPPTTIGIEGSGIVVKNGGGWLGWVYLGFNSYLNSLIILLKDVMQVFFLKIPQMVHGVNMQQLKLTNQFISHQIEIRYQQALVQQILQQLEQCMKQQNKKAIKLQQQPHQLVLLVK